MPGLRDDLTCLTTAAAACQGRVDPVVLGNAQAVIERIGRRLAWSGDLTVVALAGATGSGKSSLFNVLTRTALAEPGVRRPMTQQAMAATFGDVDTAGLLDWLDVQRRHVIAGAEMAGVVLLDLPDYDSVVASHRDLVDRLLEVVDEIIWVVDPQKYADATLHDRYLHRFAGHTEVMTFVLNQIDRLSAGQVAEIHRDLVALLQADGLGQAPVFDVSALNGQGIEGLRRHLGQTASAKQSMVARLEADVVQQARLLSEQVGPDRAGALGKEHLAGLVNACLEAAGTAEIADAVRASVKWKGRLATGWPVVSWIGRLRTDPLRRLHLDRFWSRQKAADAPELTRTSVIVHPVAQARIATAIRSVGDEASARLPRLWKQAVDRLIKQQTAALPDAVDQAVVSSDIRLGEGHGWWTFVRVCQWIILVMAFAGLVWLTVNFVASAFLGLPPLPVPRVGRLGLPTWLFLGGIVLGLLLAGLSRLGVGAGARTAAASVTRKLRRVMQGVVSAKIIAPVNDELHRHDEARAALDQILA